MWSPFFKSVDVCSDFLKFVQKRFSRCGAAEEGAPRVISVRSICGRRPQLRSANVTRRDGHVLRPRHVTATELRPATNERFDVFLRADLRYEKWVMVSVNIIL